MNFEYVLMFLAGIIYLSVGILLVIHMSDKTRYLQRVSDWLAFVMVYLWPVTLLIGWSLYWLRKKKDQVIW